MTTSRFFPIRTATACQLKWNWSTIWLHEGKTASCHRTGWGDLTPATFDQFHNTEKKQHERSLMLQGLWPEHSCHYCKDIEATGGFSDRMLHLDIPDMYPGELDANAAALSVTPTILEVYFNNTCNLSCLYCLPSISSKINQEYAKFGDWQYKDLKLQAVSTDPDFQTNLDLFWRWMRDNSLKLKRFNVLGGEPFYQQEYLALLDYFDDHAHPDLELGIVTNLMYHADKLDAMIERWKKLLVSRHLRRIDVTCSIDCWGSPQTYVRHGLDLDRWKSNFERLLAVKWLKLNINQTISVLTVKTMPDLLDHMTNWRQHHEIGHYFSEVSPGPSYLKPNILGPIFGHDFDQILCRMPNTTKQDQIAMSYMQGIQTHIATSVRNPHEADKLQKYLDENDHRRNLNWRKTFPWLVQEIDNVV